MKGTFLFLGTGSSSGVPMIGCQCEVCSSSNPKNKRLRSSGLVTLQNQQLLIDSGPDFRQQALIHQIDRLDGLLLTHSHYDHIAGLDELRIFYVRTRKPLPVLLSKATFQDIQKRYYYLFREKEEGGSLTAQLDFHLLEKERGEVQFCGLSIGHMQFEQAGMPVTGYRFGSFAYISDIKHYPETLFEDLTGLEILVVSALRKEISPLHFNIEQGIEFAQKIGAKQTYFIHMGHEIEYQETSAQLPAGIQLAYDGLKVEFDYGR